MRSFSSSCDTFASVLSTVVLSLSLLLAPTPASAVEGDVSQVAISGDWVSAKVCFTYGCVWRAATLTSNISHRGLFLDFLPGDNLHITFQTSQLSRKNLRSWKNRDQDEVRADFRVDTYPIVEALITRTLEASSRTIYEELPEELSNEAFVEQLRNGTTLRIRHHRAQTFIERISLKGAKKAIDRARSMSRKKRNLRSPDERYFEDPSIPSQPQRDGEFFL